jgi:hypothetical protein
VMIIFRIINNVVYFIYIDDLTICGHFVSTNHTLVHLLFLQRELLIAIFPYECFVLVGTSRI